MQLIQTFHKQDSVEIEASCRGYMIVTKTTEKLKTKVKNYQE